jgi:signal transduction histidine kinase
VTLSHRGRVTVALTLGIPLLAAFCVLVQWPIWVHGSVVLAAANLLVTVTFFATAVFIYGEPRHRLTGAALAAAALLWPVDWINEWNTGLFPILAALEGPLASLLAVWALLRYPAAWTRRRPDLLIGLALVLVQGLACLPVVTSLPQWHGLSATTPWLGWWPGQRPYLVTRDLYNYGIIGVAVIAVVALVARWLRLTGPDRVVMRPVAVAVMVAGALTAAGGIALVLPVSTATVDAVYTVEGVALVGVPFTFLIAAARRWQARERVPALIRDLGFSPTAAHAQQALRAALDDQGLRLLYRIGGDWVDIDGAPQPGVPADDPGTAVVTESGTANVMLCTARPLVARYRAVVLAAVRAAGLVLENTSLQAAIRNQIHEVEESAHRLSAGVDAERRSIQAAVSGICGAELAPLSAVLEELRAGDGSPGLAASVTTGHDLLVRAEVDLLRLGGGLSPAGLSEVGLAESLTDTARHLGPHITVSVEAGLLAADLQAAAYFVLSELMTNAAKHAPAAATTVRAVRSETELVLRVTDDGPGGADPAGSGLRGIADRVADLSGTMTVDSPRGRGTTVRVSLPVTADPARRQRELSG